MCLCAPSYTCIGQRYDVHSGVAIFTPSELSLNNSKQDGSWCHLREHDEIRPLVHLFGGVRTSLSLFINTRTIKKKPPPIMHTRRGPPAAAPCFVAPGPSQLGKASGNLAPLLPLHRGRSRPNEIVLPSPVAGSWCNETLPCQGGRGCGSRSKERRNLPAHRCHKASCT